MKDDFDYLKADEISIEIDGKKYSGSYFVRGKILTLRSMLGQKSTQLGGMPAEGLARLLLRELITENN